MNKYAKNQPTLKNNQTQTLDMFTNLEKERHKEDVGL